MRNPGVAVLGFLSALSCARGDPAPTPTHSAQGRAAVAPPTSVSPAAAAGPSAATQAVSLSGGGAEAAASAAAKVGGAPATVSAQTGAPDPKRYAWLAEASLGLEPSSTVAGRVPPPPGYTRVPVPAGSFGEWLRGLPLAPEGTPVTTFAGELVHPGDDDYVHAVVAIDVGKQDLQQSSDILVRLHAEWLWSRQEIDSIDYKASTKLDLPLRRWQKGQRLVTSGATVFWAVKQKPADLTYRDFREFLDQVFAWGSSTSLALDARRVDDPAALAPGDFFLHGKGKGHAVLVLDLAEKQSGERVALLLQGLNPAQSPHLLRPGKGTAWFSIRPPLPIVTPHTDEFSWEELRRFTP